MNGAETCLGNGLVKQVAFSHLFCPCLIAQHHRNYHRVLQNDHTKSYGIVIFVDLILLKTAVRESQLGQTIFSSSNLVNFIIIELLWASADLEVNKSYDEVINQIERKFMI